MAVYVDESQYRYGRMVMCHMMADTTDELLAMADAIGVQRRWLQHAGEPGEHFDVCMSKRAAAVQQGAREVTSRDLVKLVRSKRRPEGTGDTKEG